MVYSAHDIYTTLFFFLWDTMIYNYITAMASFSHTCECVEFTNFGFITFCTHLSVAALLHTVFHWYVSTCPGGIHLDQKQVHTHSIISHSHDFNYRLVDSEEYQMQHALTDYKIYNGRPRW
jgi:hypothetical protein